VVESGKEFLGRGWAFPVSISRDTGSVASAVYEADIQQSIYLIVCTSKGERLMRPDFGCGIHDLVFDVINSALFVRVRRSIEEALRTFEARIEVLQVTVDGARSLEGVFSIGVEYRVRTTNQSGNFVFPFYFKEAF